MRPLLDPGDLLLVSYRSTPSPGSIVVARLPDGTIAVKRAVERRSTVSGAPGWWLLSEDPDVGVDSRHRGPVADDAVLAVVLARLRPRPRLLARVRNPVRRHRWM